MTDRPTDRMPKRTRMSRATRVLAPLFTKVAANLLATLVAGIIAGLAGDLAGTIAPAHAQTAPAAAAATAVDNCLAAPNGPTPSGSHWRYHLERHSGRKCWYLHAQDGAAGETANVRPHAVAPVARSAAPAATPAVPAAPAPAAPPSSSPLSAAGDGNRSIAPPPVANPPTAWPGAPALQSLDSAPVQLDNAAAPARPAVDTSRDAMPAAQSPSAVTDPVPARPPVVAPSAAPAVAADEPGHTPALLGIGFAIAVIILGSLMIRRIAQRLRRRRRPVLIDLPDEDWQPQLAAAPVTPGPAMVRPPRDEWRGEGQSADPAYLDRLRESRDDEVRRYAPRHARPPQPRVEPELPMPPRVAREQPAAPRREKPAAPRREAVRVRDDREAARILENEDSVRELLTRLRAESEPKPPKPKPPVDLRAAAASRASRGAPPLHSSPVGSVDDRAAALYAWRGRKR